MAVSGSMGRFLFTVLMWSVAANFGNEQVVFQIFKEQDFQDLNIYIYVKICLQNTKYILYLLKLYKYLVNIVSYDKKC